MKIRQVCRIFVQSGTISALEDIISIVIGEIGKIPNEILWNIPNCQFRSLLKEYVNFVEYKDDSITIPALEIGKISNETL